jgi:ATP-binding cassette subfamily C (CFTR/MRP) protein 1
VQSNKGKKLCLHQISAPHILGQNVRQRRNSTMSNSSTSMDENEKEKEFGLVDPQAAAEDPTEDEPRADARYEPIKTEKSTKDVGANIETRSSRVNLSRTQSATSAFTDISEDSEPKSSIRRRKWYRTNPLKWGPRPPVPKEREVCPEYTAGIFSRLTWQWMQPLMNVGYKRPLEKNDLWSVNPKRSATVLAERLDTSFQKRLEQGHDRPLLRAMFDTFVSSPRGFDCGLANVSMFAYRNGSS